jgi:hypothetical protein
MEINSLAEAIRLCREQDKEALKNEHVFLPSSIKNKDLNQLIIYKDDFKKSHIVKKVYKFAIDHFKQLVSKHEFQWHNKKIQKTCGNRGRSITKFIQNNLVTVSDIHYVVGIKSMSYITKTKNLANLLVYCNIVKLSEEETELLKLEWFEDDELKITNKVLCTFAADFYKAQLKSELNGEKDFDYKHNDDHDRLYNETIALKKSIKYALFENYYDIDINCAQPTLIKELCKSICLNEEIGKKRKYRASLREFGAVLQKFEVEDFRNNLAELCDSKIIAKSIINILVNSGRFDLYDPNTAISYAINHDPVLAEKLSTDEKLKDFYEMFKRIWDITYSHFEDHTGEKNPATLSKVRLERKRKKQAGQYDKLIANTDLSEEEKNKLIFEKLSLMFSEAPISRKSKYKIYCYLEKKVMDIANSFIKEKSNAIVLREHDGMKVNYLPDMNQLKALIYEKLNLNINFSVGFISNGELNPI